MSTFTARDGLVFKAKLSEESKRYNDMAEALAGVIKMGEGLNSQERNMMSIAFKNRIGKLRHSIRLMNQIDGIGTYSDKLNAELRTIADECLDLLKVYLIGSDFEKIKEECAANKNKGEEGRELIEKELFYMKMAGDVSRYKAEIFKDDESIKVQAKEFYEKSQQIAEHLETTNPVRLRLALNFSVFYSEIIMDSERACLMAKKSFDSAINDMGDLSEYQIEIIMHSESACLMAKKSFDSAIDGMGDMSEYQDSTLILQLLKDNLSLWTSADQENEEDW